MTVGQDKPVTIRPVRMFGAVLEKIVPEHFGNVRHAQRHTWMPGVGSLNRVHAQRSNRVGQFAP